MVNTELVKSFRHFSGLGSAELETIRRSMFERMAGRGELIILDGEPAEALFFVVAGVVKIFKTSAEGKEQILNIVQPRESFNDAPVLDGLPNPISAQAMTPTMLYGLKRTDLLALMRQYPQVTTNLSLVMAQQVRQLVALVEDLSFKNVIGRVAKMLLEPPNGDGIGRPRLTQQEMAALAGTAREMVGRSLKSLENEGIIRFERHRIIIADKKALMQIAGTER